MSKEITRDDLLCLYNRTMKQFDEDRESIRDLFDELRGNVLGSPNLYIECGDTLAKYADLMIKQTSQVIEFTKIAAKVVEEDTGLSESDYDLINQYIEDTVDDDDSGSGKDGN